MPAVQGLKVNKLLNRLLCIPLELQANIFSCFSAMLVGPANPHTSYPLLILPTHLLHAINELDLLCLLHESDHAQVHFWRFSVWWYPCSWISKRLSARLQDFQVREAKRNGKYDECGIVKPGAKNIKFAGSEVSYGCPHLKPALLQMVQKSGELWLKANWMIIGC